MELPWWLCILCSMKKTLLLLKSFVMMKSSARLWKLIWRPYDRKCGQSPKPKYGTQSTANKTLDWALMTTWLCLLLHIPTSGDSTASLRSQVQPCKSLSIHFLHFHLQVRRTQAPDQQKYNVHYFKLFGVWQFVIWLEKIITETNHEVIYNSIFLP